MFILKILSYIFLFFVKIRIFLYQCGFLKSYKIDNVKIISIGNIAMGGTGKTPVTIKIGDNLLKKGFKVAVLLRGYKRKNKDEILTVHNGEKFVTNVEQSGDEAYLIAKKLKCPVVVSKNRVKGAKFLKDKFSPDFILLDDGFQHLKLKRDKDIVLITGDSLIKKIYLFPADKFREPLSHIKRADTIIITKIDSLNRKKISFFKQKYKKPVYLAKINLKYFINLKTGEKISLDFFKNKKVIIFSGIAQPSYFKALITANDIEVFKEYKFTDHYFYREKDYKIFNKFNIPLITTEKDAVKLNSSKITPPVFYTSIEYSFHKS